MDTIEACYGPGVNLYEVLQVDHEASQKTIQSSFVKRRMELFKSMDNKSPAEKDWIEKQMDATSVIFRILRDPIKRQNYDNTLRSSPKTNRATRRSRPSPQSVSDYNESPQNVSKSLSNELRDLTVSTSASTMCSNDGSAVPTVLAVSPQTPLVSNNRRSDVVQPEAEPSSPVLDIDNSFSTVETMTTFSTAYDVETNDTIEEYYRDLVTPHETTLGAWLRKSRCINQADAIDQCSSEITGSLADIWLTFQQVINVFSVDDYAIDSLAENIGDAAEDLSSRKYRR